MIKEIALKYGVIRRLEKPVKLKSGTLSSVYVDWRSPCQNAEVLDRISDFIISYTERNALSPASFYGVPESMTKLGILTQYKWWKKGRGAEIIAMGRGRQKEHGLPKDRYFLGVPVSPVIIIEDVITTANTLLEEMGKLKEAGVEVLAAYVLTDRREKPFDIGIPLHAFTHLREFL